jgi:hypothetical protein
MDLVRNEDTVWSYSGDVLENGVRAFCARCNNGWMSELEVRTARIVRPMLRGKIDGPISMRFVDQQTVASWALKTALVLQQLHTNESYIPESFYREFHRIQQPSSDVFVMMGTRQVAGDRRGMNLFDYKEKFVGRSGSGIQHIHFVVGFVYFGIAIFIGQPRRFPLHERDRRRALRLDLALSTRPRLLAAIADRPARRHQWHV